MHSSSNYPQHPIQGGGHSDPFEMYIRSKDPYPEIHIEQQNPAYAAAMLDNIGGCNSEMSAVSLYFYNHLATLDYQEIATVFHQVSIVEMHHLETFGKLAIALGENPRLWSQRGRQKVYWSPAYNQYPVPLPKLLRHALESEREAVQKYEMQLRRIKDPCIQENLHRIIEDEMLHIQLFNELCEAYA